MKNRSLPLAAGIALLLIASLFSYSRTETMGGATTRMSLDGAALATMVLCVALFFVCRRISRTIHLALRRAGLPPEIPIPVICICVIGLAAPLLVVGSGASWTEGNITQSWAFGMSSFQLSAFVLVILVVWLISLARRLRELAEHLQRNSGETGSETTSP